MNRPRSLFGLSAAALVLVAACSSGGAASTPAVAQPTAVASAVATADASGAASSSSAVTARVSANSASESELTAALTAAGVPNADRWAREVMEYRPYDTSDATLQKLQDNLAKYNPDSTTLAGILSALVP